MGDGPTQEFDVSRNSFRMSRGEGTGKRLQGSCPVGAPGDDLGNHRVVVGRDDIALLKSSKPFGLSFYPALATGEENVGDTVSIVGYGITGRLSTGYDTVDNVLRAGTNTIERFENSLIICEARRKSSPFEYCISPGDSGGPLFCRGRLAGINSITMRAGRGGLRSREGEETGHTRVSLYREWIKGVMEGGK